MKRIKVTRVDGVFDILLLKQKYTMDILLSI